MKPRPMKPRRTHLTRLMAIWRSAGWPWRDGIELDLVAAGWATLTAGTGGHETVRLTDAGIRLVADARQRGQRALSAHDQLAAKMAAHLVAAGRVVWCELSLRARIAPDEALPGQGKASWRMARPDVFSVRRTTVENYLQPMVHEVKVSRADLLSDLRHAAKREAYQWLSCETYYVLPAGVAEPEEIPEAFGIWLLNGAADTGTLTLARTARHTPCQLPFSVWMALAQAAPTRMDGEPAQMDLADLEDLTDLADPADLADLANDP